MIDMMIDIFWFTTFLRRALGVWCKEIWKIVFIELVRADDQCHHANVPLFQLLLRLQFEVLPFTVETHGDTRAPDKTHIEAVE